MANEGKSSIRQVIRICGEGIDVDYASLTEQEAEKILSGAASNEWLQDRFDEGGAEGGVTQAVIEVDGADVQTFDRDAFPDGPAFQISVNPGAWILVRFSTERGSFRAIEIRETFNPENLKCYPQYFDLRGFKFGFLSFSYLSDGEELEGEFDETYYRNQETFLISPQGDRFEV